MMQYKDFVIDLAGYNSETRQFSVRVSEMPGWDAHAPNYAERSQLPEDLLDLQAELALGTLQRNEIERFGNLLFEALLPEQGRNSTSDLFRQARRNLNPDQGLRLCLRFGQTDLALAGIAWEYLWVEGEGTPLLLDRKCSMARVEVLAGERQGNLTTPVNIRMLGLFANPASTERLDLNKDVESLKKLHQKLPDRIQQILVPSTANSSQKITRSWLRQFFVDHGDVQILHFSGHGYVITRMADEVGKLKQEGGLILLKEDSTADFCPAANIAGYLADRDVRLVVLSACEGARRDAFNPWQTVATALIGRGIPAVIGMQFEIADAHAIVFNQAFYHALASGLSIDEAVWAARWAIWDCELPEDANTHVCAFGMAALYLRGKGDLVLFPKQVLTPAHPSLNEPNNNNSQGVSVSTTIKAAIQPIRDIFIQLYRKSANATLVAEDANINLTNINTDGAILVIWNDIFTEAENQGKLDDLITRGAREYEGNKNLREAIAHYRTLIKPADTSTNVQEGVKMKIESLSDVELRDKMAELFSLSDLELICKEIPVDWEEIPGVTKKLRIQNLIDYLKRRSRIPVLLSAVKKARPDDFV